MTIPALTQGDLLCERCVVIAPEGIYSDVQVTHDLTPNFTIPARQLRAWVRQLQQAPELRHAGSIYAPVRRADVTRVRATPGGELIQLGTPQRWLMATRDPAMVIQQATAMGWATVAEALQAFLLDLPDTDPASLPVELALPASKGRPSTIGAWGDWGQGSGTRGWDLAATLRAATPTGARAIAGKLLALAPAVESRASGPVLAALRAMEASTPGWLVGLLVQLGPSPVLLHALAQAPEPGRHRHER